MIEDRLTTVAFTGHRTYWGQAAAALRAAIGEMYARGFRTFLCGMAVGFDLAAAEAVLACRDCGRESAAPVLACRDCERETAAPVLACRDCGREPAPPEIPASGADFVAPSGSVAVSQIASAVTSGLAPDAGDILAAVQSTAGCLSAPGTSPSGAFVADPSSACVPVSVARDATALFPIQGRIPPQRVAPVFDARPMSGSEPFPISDPALRDLPQSPPCENPMPGLRLVAVVPFQGQASRFSAADRERFHRVLAAADRSVTLSPSYHAGCYAVRNNYLIDHASLLVAWYDGSPGGTHYTVRRALARGLELVNLHPQPAVDIPPPDPTLF